MVINEAMARALWPGEDPIGKRIGNRGPNPNWREVVGVVGDITFPSFGASSNVDTEFQTFQPLAQTGTQFVNILLRTDREPDADLVRLAAHRLDARSRPSGVWPDDGAGGGAAPDRKSATARQRPRRIRRPRAPPRGARHLRRRVVLHRTARQRARHAHGARCAPISRAVAGPQTGRRLDDGGCMSWDWPEDLRSVASCHR